MNTQITRWNPLRDMEQMQKRMASLWSSPLSLINDEADETLLASEWSPRVDITEDDREFVVKAEVPDIKREDVKITVENQLLTMAGERRQEKEEKNKKYHRIEREYGSFTRSFSLPANVAADKVTADFKDGILQVHLPKDGKGARKSIEIKAS